MEAGAALSTPLCPVCDDCGGCSWQRVPYSRQLEWKAQLIEESARDHQLELPEPCVVEPSPLTFQYRNHMEFSFAAKRWLTTAEIASGRDLERGFALGLHAPGGFGRVLDLEGCPLQSSRADEAFLVVKQFAATSGLPAWDARTHEGFWRYLILKRGHNTGELLVHVVTSRSERDLLSRLAEDVFARVEGVMGVTNGVTERVADTSEGAVVETIAGRSFIHERLGGLTVEVGPMSFFQPNTLAAERIVQIVKEFASSVPADRVIDLFCGSGLLGLSLAAEARTVTGVEVVREALDAAERNARLNGAQNVRFIQADLLRGWPSDLPQAADLVVCDPPRAGFHPKALRALIAMAPEAILHVGCNPKTQARDLATLMREGGYRPIRNAAVDQFPNTPHVENIVLLVKESGS